MAAFKAYKGTYGDLAPPEQVLAHLAIVPRLRQKLQVQLPFWSGRLSLARYQVVPETTPFALPLQCCRMSGSPSAAAYICGRITTSLTHTEQLRRYLQKTENDVSIT